MADNFLGEIRVFPFNFIPRGWHACDGSLLPISSNTALFSLIGTYYGGDGRQNFAVPDFQGRLAVGHGQGVGLSEYINGEKGGLESVSLHGNELPAHTHTVAASATTGTDVDPAFGVYAPGNVSSRFGKLYGSTRNSVSAGVIGTEGYGNLPHENRAPSLGMTVAIAVTGIFPSRP